MAAEVVGVVAAAPNIIISLFLLFQFDSRLIEQQCYDDEDGGRGWGLRCGLKAVPFGRRLSGRWREVSTASWWRK